MQFVLTGFTHDLGSRVFAFDRVAEDWARTKCTVSADLGLIRKYGIQIQELPLLCRRILDRHEESGEIGPFIFSEEEMGACAAARTAARELAASKRKPRFKPPAENLGAAWRGQQA